MSRTNSKPTAIIIDPVNGNDGASGTTDGIAVEAAAAIAAAGAEPIIIEPGDYSGGGSGSAADNSSEPRRRGRPPGSGNRKAASGGPSQKAKVAIEVNVIEAMLMNIHAGVSFVTKIEELAIDKQEAETLAKAGSHLMSFYDVPVASEKAMAWMNMLTAIGMVYTPRLISMRVRAMNNPKPPKAAQPAKPLQTAPARPAAQPDFTYDISMQPGGVVQ